MTTVAEIAAIVAGGVALLGALAWMWRWIWNKAKWSKWVLIHWRIPRMSYDEINADWEQIKRYWPFVKGKAASERGRRD